MVQTAHRGTQTKRPGERGTALASVDLGLLRTLPLVEEDCGQVLVFGHLCIRQDVFALFEDVPGLRRHLSYVCQSRDTRQTCPKKPKTSLRWPR
jgi:hypothetical protein